MPEDPLGTERAPLPTLLRRARRAYAEAIQSALADSGCDDVPRNGAFVLGATAATGAQLSQIIRELRVSKQAAGQLIDTLVSRGYLVRSVDPADRRRLNITLTERGLAAAGVIGAAVGAVDERLAGRVSPADVQAARRVLGALIDLEADPEADPGGDGGPPDHGSAHDHGHPHEHRHPHDHRHPRDHGHPHYHGGGDLAELAGPRLARTGLDRLGEHLAATYGITVTGLAELDLGVYQVDRGDGGSWVARVLPAVREAGRTAADRDVLRFAESAGFPAERCAAAEPVSVLDGQDVLVTDYVPGLRGERRQEVIRARGGLRRLGDLLGWLHVLPGGAGAAAGRDGGAWHHLADGGPSAEIAAARAQLTAAASRVPAGQEHLHASLLAELAGLDDGAGLPQALVHPDFVLANVIATADRGMILVDWTGAGRGPRLWPLAFLLYSAAARDLRRVDRVLDGYRRRVTLEPAEVDRMAAVARARPVVLQSWLFCAGRQDLPGALAAAGRARELADAMAVRVRAALGG